MLLTALDQAGGVDYLVAQAHKNPKAFLALVGRVIPTQLSGPDGRDLVPPSAATPDRVAAVFLALAEGLPRARAPLCIVDNSRSDDGEG